MNPRRLLPLLTSGALLLTGCGVSEDAGSAIGTTEDGRPVYAFPSDDAVRAATQQANEREGGGMDWGDIYRQRKTWNGQADYTCTRLKDGHNLEEIAADSFGPLIKPEDQIARLENVVTQACPELAL